MADFIEGAERLREVSPAVTLYVPLPHESDRESEADMEQDNAVSMVGTPTRDERYPAPPAYREKRSPSPDTVVTTDIAGRRLVLAATDPTYTPPPVGGLHGGLRMVVADLTQTYSPPPDPACGDQWRGPDYVPTPVAELERLEARKAELQEEIRERNAGYSINWAQGQSPPALTGGSPNLPAPNLPHPIAGQGVVRSRPSAFHPYSAAAGASQDAPPAYSDPINVRGAGTIRAEPAPPPPQIRQEMLAVTDTEELRGSFLEQFIPAERAPLDAEGDELATNTARLINSLWNNPMTKAETAEVYATLPRPANATGLHKTRMNPEIEPTLPQRVKDNDAALAAAHWGIQFAARPIVGTLDKIELGQKVDTKELVAALVTTLKVLARTSNTLAGLRRDNVRPALQPRIKPLAKKDGNQGFKYLLGEDLTTQVNKLETSQKTANTIIRSYGKQQTKNFNRSQGNYRGGQGRGRLTQYTPRQTDKLYNHRPSGQGQTRPHRGGRGRGAHNFRGRTGRQ